MKPIAVLPAALLAIIGALILLTMKNPVQAADPSELPDEIPVRLLGKDGQPGPVEVVPTVKKSPEEWKAQLGEEAYRVLRSESTERPFCGTLLDNKEKGVYFCAGCELPLFTSGTKFESGTGWPSFYQPFAAENIGEDRDVSYGMARTEIHCARCGGHLGHVFPDGPPPTGNRYCINSVSLTFKSYDEMKTPLGAVKK